MTLLTLDKVSVTQLDRALITNLDLTINAGECWAILGRNGVGKTSLLHTMAAIRKPYKGRVKLFGTNTTELKRKDIARTVGVLLQQQEQGFPARVFDLVAMGRYPHNKSWLTNNDEQQVEQALQGLSLEGLQHRDIQTLSGGEQRRVEIATVFAQEPNIFLLDEPINHLDIAFQTDVLQQVKQKTQLASSAAIMVLHDVNMVSQFCDHCLMMFSEGEYLAGKTEDVLNTNNLQKLYGQKFQQLETIAATKVFLPI